MRIRCHLTTGVVLAILLCVPGRAEPPIRVSNSEAAQSSTVPFLCVGYLPWYRTAGFSAERLRGVTDLIYFGVKPTDDGRFDDQSLDATTLRQLRTLKQAAGCRLLLCVGGGERSQGFPPLIADTARRHRFVQALCTYCRQHDFDGVDYDWEHPEGETQLAAYADLLAETKSGLGPEGLITIAQSPWRDFGSRLYEVVDRVHVMSYNHKFPQAQLQASRDDVQRMLDWGCPREKLLLGLPFYGRNQRGQSKTYADLAGRGTVSSDLVQGYALNGPETVRAKTRTALEAGLGGVMVWELGQDSRNPETSLLQVIKNEIESK